MDPSEVPLTERGSHSRSRIVGHPAHAVHRDTSDRDQKLGNLLYWGPLGGPISIAHSAPPALEPAADADNQMGDITYDAAQMTHPGQNQVPNGVLVLQL